MNRLSNYEEDEDEDDEEESQQEILALPPPTTTRSREAANQKEQEIQSISSAQLDCTHQFKSLPINPPLQALPPNCPLPSIPTQTNHHHLHFSSSSSSSHSNHSSIDLTSFNHYSLLPHHPHSQSHPSLHHSSSLSLSSNKLSSVHHRLNSYSLSNLMLPYQHSNHLNYHRPSLNNLSYSSNQTSISPSSSSPINTRHPPSSVSPSKYLLTVIPPESLPSDHPRTSLACTGYGPAQAFRRGTLIPLYPTLSSQKAAIAREYGLPSTGGMVLYLIEGSAFSGEMGKHIAGGPRVGEHAWQMLWSSIFEEEELAALEADVIARERLLAEQRFHLSQDSDHHHHQQHHHLHSNRNQSQSFDEDNSEEILNSHHTFQSRSRSVGFPSHSPSASFSSPHHSHASPFQPINPTEYVSDPETDVDPICMPTPRHRRGSNLPKITRGSSLPQETSSASNHLPHKPTLTRLNRLGSHSHSSPKLAPCNCSSMTYNQESCRHVKGPNSIDSTSSLSMDASLRSSLHQNSVPQSPVTYASRPSIDSSRFSAPPDHQTFGRSSGIPPCRSYTNLNHQHHRNRSDLFGMGSRASLVESMSDFSSSSLGQRANRPVGVGVIVGKIEFDIDRRRGNGRWYDQWLEGATINDLPSSSRPPSAQPSPSYEALSRSDRPHISDPCGPPQPTGRAPLYLPSLITNRESTRDSKLTVGSTPQPRNLTPTSANSTQSTKSPALLKTEPSPAQPSFPISSLIPVERTRTRTPQHDREATIRSTPTATPQDQIQDPKLAAEVSSSEKSDQPEDEASPRSAYSSQDDMSQPFDKAVYEQLSDDQDQLHHSQSSGDQQSSGSDQLKHTTVKKTIDPLAGVFPSDEATWSNFDSGLESENTTGTIESSLSAGLGLNFGQLNSVEEEFEAKAEEGPNDVEEVMRIIKERDNPSSLPRTPLPPIKVPLSPIPVKLKSPVRTSSLLSSPINLDHRSTTSSPNASRIPASPLPLTNTNPLRRSSSQALPPSQPSVGSQAMTVRGFRNSRTLDSSGSISNSGLVTRSSQVSNKRSSTADMQADLDDLEKTLAALSPQALKFSPRTSPLATDELLKKLKQKEERRSHRGKELNEVRPPLPLPSKPSQPPQPLPLPSRAAPESQPILPPQPPPPQQPSVSFTNLNNSNVKKTNEENHGNQSPINKIFSTSTWNLKRNKPAVVVVEEPVMKVESNEKVLIEMGPSNSSSIWSRRRWKSVEDEKKRSEHKKEPHVSPQRSIWKNAFGGSKKVEEEEEDDFGTDMEMGDEEDAPEMIRRHREFRPHSNSNQFQPLNQAGSDKKSKRPSGSSLSLGFRKRLASMN